MIQLTSKQDCVGCNNCANICPKQCITMKLDNEGFIYPFVNTDCCIHCNKCIKVCPVIQKIEEHEAKPLQIIGANHKSDKFRLRSSSGGVFGEIASFCLKHGGIVWGAAWKSSYEVYHTYITDIKQLGILQKSKYVQSSLHDSFIHLKKQLTNTKLIVFSGTPCQIKALYHFIGYRPKNLLTVEIVCHGVPSSLVLQKYLEEQKWTSIDFRNKEKSWSKYSVEFQKKEGGIQKEVASENLYMKGFLKDLFTRPSCEKCPAKAFKSQADYTLGDYWGCNTYAPDLYDDKGTSIVFIHTPKALSVWESIKDSFFYKKETIEHAIEYNPCIMKSVVLSPLRNSFFKNMDYSVMKSIKRYTKEKTPFKKYIKQQIIALWNLLWFIYNKIKYLWLSILDKTTILLNHSPYIESIEATLNYIIEKKCSVSRYGDGEMKFVFGNETWFQKTNPILKKRLTEILKENIPNHIVCIPPIFDDLSIYQDHDRTYWHKYIISNRKKWYQSLDLNKIYYNAFISRCYLPYRDKTNVPSWFNLWLMIWNNKDVIIIEGEKSRLGVGNNLFNNTKSIKRILAPNTNAFNYYNNIIEETKKYSTNHLILLALGPTATVLASDLSKLGYQAIDIGHIDIEYEWYLMKVNHKVPIPNKFVNEAGAGKGVGNIEDEKYKSEIVCQF